MRDKPIKPVEPLQQRSPEQAQAVAEAAAKAMYAKDNASQSLGMKIHEVRPGYARLSMPVHSSMLNGHAYCHGGFIFALADSAFAFACNSRNQNTVASGCDINYLAPCSLNDVLSAEAIEQSLAGRTGVYDVTVSNQNGKAVALFRGRSYRVRGEVVSGLDDALAHPHTPNQE